MKIGLKYSKTNLKFLAKAGDPYITMIEVNHVPCKGDYIQFQIGDEASYHQARVENREWNWAPNGDEPDVELYVFISDFTRDDDPECDPL